MFGIVFDSLPLCVCMSCAKMIKSRGLVLSKIFEDTGAGGYIYVCCAAYMLILFSHFNFKEKLSDITDYHSKLAILGVFLLKSVIGYLSLPSKN